MALTTQAAILRAAGRRWELAELELDEPQEHEVRIRFAASGLCHSDELVRTGDIGVRYPIVGGHEGAGVVEAVGAGVTRVAPGDHVVCSILPVCGTCRYCSTGHQSMCARSGDHLDGRFPDGTFRFHSDGEDLGGLNTLGTLARRAVVHEWSCVPIDDDIPFDVAALLGCGVPTGWGSAVYVAGVRPGETVVVYGVGGVGSNAVQGARYAGAKAVVAIDPAPLKLEQAELWGATHAFADPDEAHAFVAESTRGELAEHAIVAGALTPEVVRRAIAIVGKLGKVTIAALGRQEDVTLEVDAGMLIGGQRLVQGALYGGCNPLYDIPMLAGLYRAGRLKLDELVSRRYALDEVNEGYRDMLDGKNMRGVIVHDG